MPARTQVMQVDDVETVDSGALYRVLEAPQDAIAGVIEPGQHPGIPLAGAGQPAKGPAHLCRQRHVWQASGADRSAKPPFRLAQPVERSRIEVPYTAAMTGDQRILGRVGRDLTEHPADGRPAKAQLGDRDARGPDPTRFAGA